MELTLAQRAEIIKEIHKKQIKSELDERNKKEAAENYLRDYIKQAWPI